MSRTQIASISVLLTAALDEDGEEEGAKQRARLQPHLVAGALVLVLSTRSAAVSVPTCMCVCVCVSAEQRRNSADK